MSRSGSASDACGARRQRERPAAREAAAAGRRRGPRASPSTRSRHGRAADGHVERLAVAASAARARRTCDPRHAGAAHLGDPHRAPLPGRRLGVPGANAARRISIRKRFARSGAGSRTTPSAPTASGGVSPFSVLTRTCVGRRTPGTGSSVNVVTVVAAGRSHSSHDAPVAGPVSDPRLRRAVERARGTEAGTALEARRRGIERILDPDELVELRVGDVLRRRSGPAVELPGPGRRRRRSRAPGRARRRRGRARARRPPSRARARAGTGRRPSCAGRDTSGRCARRRGPPARARPAPATAAPRVTVTPGISQLADPPAPAVGPSGLRTAAIRIVSLRSRSGPDRQVVPARLHG